jgi:hypothetical protein
MTAADELNDRVLPSQSRTPPTGQRARDQPQAPAPIPSTVPPYEPYRATARLEWARPSQRLLRAPRRGARAAAMGGLPRQSQPGTALRPEEL